MQSQTETFWSLQQTDR